MTYQNRLHPWCIVRQLPKMQKVVVDRFRRHQEADSRATTLRRLTPNATFVVLFDPTPAAIPAEPTVPAVPAV
ncbi:hypothetical protein [Leptolyngbya sp. PCC 6406]|uniref:hypothetical protein n=1 Tax=Leptolyngbya sp. PCC 6406 TaxID=1173264 RepID=UPI0002AC02CF|nr:hypothetical protein [Leptolyngbya sp. PCC 6406]